IIRQAVDNFSLEKKASMIIALMNSFHKQWEKFIESLEKMGRRIDDAKKEYDVLMSTRRTQLEKPLLFEGSPKESVTFGKAELRLSR
ncbi:MAG: DNA recombination protein RmuC, partial [Bacteroidetes bacterium]|nr:DNA recombination protein RmuC [Bacteroidota bacterium]